MATQGGDDGRMSDDKIPLRYVFLGFFLRWFVVIAVIVGLIIGFNMARNAGPTP